jgi:SAM-dependent methyltransferase
MSDPGLRRWDERYAQAGYLFGEQPNAFLARQKHRLRSRTSALAVADGEGRNGVWLAEQGLEVLSVDGSAVAQEKARQLAERRGVDLRFELADLSEWEWPERQYDVVAAIFIQFAGPQLRARMFEGMRRALRPGGLLLLEGYRPEQLAYGTGGPSVVENLYTEALLRDAFADMQILELSAYDAAVAEGSGHSGISALIDMVARQPG